MTEGRQAAAAKERKRRLKALRDVVKVCNCTWPLDVMRNRTGHANTCPAHKAGLAGTVEVPKDSWRLRSDFDVSPQAVYPGRNDPS